MKKITAILLAVAMLLALAIPAFAAGQLDANTPEGDVLVKTLEEDEFGNDAERYTVSIPADTEIPWGETDAVAIDYAVEAHLRAGNRLQVQVAGSGVMTYVHEQETYTLDYTLDGATAYLSDSPVVYGGAAAPAVTQNLSVIVDEEAWGYATVGTYSDTLTFTSEIVSA